MRETPRPRETAGDTRAEPPQPRPGRATAHAPGAFCSGTPHRSDGRSPQTPRGARRPDPFGRPGTTPPVPGRPPLLLALCALLFALVTWQVAVGGPLRRVDERVGRDLAGSRFPEGVAEFLADLGNLVVAVPVLVAVIAYVGSWGRRAGAYRWWLGPVAAAGAMVLVPLLVVPLKAAVARPGPPGMAGDGYYPSGHAATATVAYGAAALLLLPLPHGAYGRRALLCGCAVLNLGVGFGLVRRGYHWPLDVVASWLLFAVLLRVLLGVTTRFGTPPPPSGGSSGDVAQPK
ncbi:phosphatase PAP2 family protein [Streptomyces alfalfae]|uniref:Phosphatase PAP2 family protein n=1 Tax=Streptomyces alfalfae TaxID=1642299 RepID=A0A7T4PK01_9ACTN|nr:phosphatase PAP2 family protein [Streptomyces alfalfae]QQC91666.1 phosphatase PAP2 family protein [Streptomyces alfalfae]